MKLRHFIGRHQCSSLLLTRRGLAWTWCLKKPGHRGHHRGYRAQWDRNGKRVPITEKMPEWRAS